MTTTTTLNVPVTMYRRDAQYYLQNASRPAVPQIKDIIRTAISNGNDFSPRVEFEVPRDLAERFMRLSKRPIRLPASYMSLNRILADAVNTTPRTEEDRLAAIAAQQETDFTGGGNFDDGSDDAGDDFNMEDVVSDDDLTDAEGESAVDEVETLTNEVENEASPAVDQDTDDWEPTTQPEDPELAARIDAEREDEEALQPGEDPRPWPEQEAELQAEFHGDDSPTSDGENDWTAQQHAAEDATTVELDRSGLDPNVL